ncbi:hypothetical protein D3C87_886130 [compost metagenome]
MHSIVLVMLLIIMVGMIFKSCSVFRALNYTHIRTLRNQMYGIILAQFSVLLTIAITLFQRHVALVNLW